MRTGVPRTVGVEEEFLLVDPSAARTCPVASHVLRIASARGGIIEAGEPAGSLVHELQEEQLEAFTSPHTSMTLLESELRAARARADAAAREAGARLVAGGTAPTPVAPHRVRTPRYDRMAERFGLVTHEQLTCGCHVHVGVASRDEGVAVLDRLRVWLPCLLALSANSPFWQGHDTGYASFRSQALGRWPVSGPSDVFGSADAYARLVDGLLATGTVLDEGMLYFDARCSHRYPTVEIRVADVCLDVRDAVLLAALGRALVETSAREWTAGEPAPPVPTTVLRLATWQAARWGVSGELLDPGTARQAPASDVVAALVDHVRPALQAGGDEVLVSAGVERVLLRGNGAARQRDVLAKTGRLDEVLAMLVRLTHGEAD